MMSQKLEMELREAAADALDAVRGVGTRMVARARVGLYPAGPVITHPAGFTLRAHVDAVTGEACHLIACGTCPATWETREGELAAVTTGERHAKRAH